MADEKLVAAILRDRGPYGWTEIDARAAAERYEAWCSDLEKLEGKVPELTPVGRENLRRILDRSLLRPGRGAALYAAQGRGKTNALAFVTQLVLRYRPELEVFTNVPYPWWAGAGKAPPRLHLVESLSGLLRGLSNRTMVGKWSAVLIDEFDQADTSHSWATAGSESWAKYLFVARHYLTRGPLVVFHSFHFIPLTIRGGAVGSPFKLVNVHGERRIGDLENPKGPWVGVIPESDLPYLTFGLRGFRIDVDVQELEAQFTGPEFAGDVEAVARATLAYLGRGKPAYERLRELKAETNAAEVAIQEVVEADVLAGLTYRQIQAKRGVTTNLIASVRKRLQAAGRLTLDASGARSPRAGEESGTSTLPDEDERGDVDRGSTT